MGEIFVFFLLLYYFVYFFFQEPTSFLGRRSVITYLTSLIVLFHAFLFAGVPYAPSAAQILHQIGAFFLRQFLQRVVEVLITLFIHQLGGVFLCQIL